MGDVREGVYTQLATAINSFVEHKVTKIDFYNRISGLIEMSSQHERDDRFQYEKFWNENKDIIVLKDKPYSNWKNGLDEVST